MELTFLGTSSGVPTKERNVSAIALKTIKSKKWCLIDCGEGTQQQILKTKLSLNQLEAIFITHLHGDHCYGLPGLLASAGMSGRKENLIIIAPNSVFKYLDSVIKTTELFLPYDLEYIDVETLGKKQLEQLNVTAIELSHRAPSFAYIFKSRRQNNQLKTQKLVEANIPPAPYWGQIQKDMDVCVDGITYVASEYIDVESVTKKIIICGDNDQPQLLSTEAIEADVIVHESTYTDEILLKVGSSPMHCSAKRIAIFAEETNIKNLVLTHFSPRYIKQKSANKNSIEEIETEAKENYQGNLFLANDYDYFFLNDNRILEAI